MPYLAIQKYLLKLFLKGDKRNSKYESQDNAPSGRQGTEFWGEVNGNKF